MITSYKWQIVYIKSYFLKVFKVYKIIIVIITLIKFDQRGKNTCHDQRKYSLK